MNVIEYFILHLLLFSAVSQSLKSAEWPQHTRCAHGGDGPEPTLRRHALSPYGAFPLPALRGFCLVCESSFVLKLPNVLREKLIACVRLTHGSSSWSKIFVDLAEGSGGAAREGLRAQPSRPVTPPFLRHREPLCHCHLGQMDHPGRPGEATSLAPGIRSYETVEIPGWAPGLLWSKALKTHLPAFRGITGTGASGNLSEVPFQSRGGTVGCKRDGGGGGE